MDKGSQPKLKRCFVLRETQLDLAKLRHGDVFRIEGDSRFFVATKDAVPTTDGVPGNFVVESEQLAMVRVFHGEQLRLKVIEERSANPIQLKGKKK